MSKRYRSRIDAPNDLDMTVTIAGGGGEGAMVSVMWGENSAGEAVAGGVQQQVGGTNDPQRNS